MAIFPVCAPLKRVQWYKYKNVLHTWHSTVWQKLLAVSDSRDEISRTQKLISHFLQIQSELVLIDGEKLAYPEQAARTDWTVCRRSEGGTITDLCSCSLAQTISRKWGRVGSEHRWLRGHFAISGSALKGMKPKHSVLLWSPVINLFLAGRWWYQRIKVGHDYSGAIQPTPALLSVWAVIKSDKSSFLFRASETQQEASASAQSKARSELCAAPPPGWRELLTDIDQKADNTPTHTVWSAFSLNRDFLSDRRAR